MLLFWLHNKKRITANIPLDVSVAEAKNIIAPKFGLTSPINKNGNVMGVFFAGSELKDSWVIGDLGIPCGSTIKIKMRQEVTPLFYVYCAYNRETLPMTDDVIVGEVKVGELKSLVSRRTGLPVTMFRFLAKDRQEMYDSYSLGDYGVQLGHTVVMETWDGWKNFLRHATTGYTAEAVSHLSPRDAFSRYQMKVALYIAARFGHVDLATSVLKHGIRADEPVGEHPLRQWCSESSHPESLKTPVHVAAEAGQFIILRLFVSQDICCVLAKDGKGLTPLSVSLRNRQKQCASFLLTKQWSKVYVGSGCSLPLALYGRVRRWCERAKSKVLLFCGPSKSSLKRHLSRAGPLVNCGVVVDGFSPSQMNSKSGLRTQKQKKDLSGRALLYAESGDGSYSGQSLVDFLKKQTGTNQFRQPSVQSPGAGNERLCNSFSTAYTSSTVFRNPSRYKRSQSETKREKYFKNVKFSPVDESSDSVFMAAEEEEEEEEALKPTSLPANPSGLFGKIRNHLKTSSVPSLSSTSGPRHGPVEFPLSPSNQGSKISGVIRKKPETRRNSENARLTLHSSSLPAIRQTGNPRPFFYFPGSGGKIISETLASFQKYRKVGPRARAESTLEIAETFRKKPWLLRLQMAMSLTTQPVKRKLRPLCLQ